MTLPGRDPLTPYSTLQAIDCNLHRPLVRMETESSPIPIFVGCTCGWTPEAGRIRFTPLSPFTSMLQETDPEEDWIRHVAWALSSALLGVKVSVMPAQPGRPRRPDVIRILERGDYIRAAGDAICDVCECTYREHDEVRGFPGIHRTCNGSLVKL